MSTTRSAASCHPFCLVQWKCSLQWVLGFLHTCQNIPPKGGQPVLKHQLCIFHGSMTASITGWITPLCILRKREIFILVVSGSPCYECNQCANRTSHNASSMDHQDRAVWHTPQKAACLYLQEVHAVCAWIVCVKLGTPNNSCWNSQPKAVGQINLYTLLIFFIIAVLFLHFEDQQGCCWSYWSAVWRTLICTSQRSACSLSCLQHMPQLRQPRLPHSLLWSPLALIDLNKKRDNILFCLFICLFACF